MGSQNKDPLVASPPRDKSTKRSISDRLLKLQSAHGRALAMNKYIKAEHPSNLEIARRLSECGQWLLFRHYYQIDEYRLHSANFCKMHLLCPLCAIRRAGKAVDAYLKRLDAVLIDQPKLKPYLVTLTTKDGPCLPERFNHLQNCVAAYHKQRKQANHGRRSPVEANKAAGAVWSYESVIGKNSGEWHVHCHCIWLCEEAPDKWQLSQDWHSVTGDSYIVDVTPISPDDPASGFVEVFKYAVKFSELPLHRTWEAYLFLRGRRLISSFGCFRGVEIPDSLLDTPIENEPYVELFYKYIDDQYVLQNDGFKHENPKNYSEFFKA